MSKSAKRIAFQLVPCCMLLAATVGLAGCASSARLPVSAGTGAEPTLPPPDKSLIPLVHVVTAKGWPEGARPSAAEGTAVAAFAQGLDHPRWLYVLPNGDVLVSETNAPPRPEDNKGIKGWFFKLFQKKAGGAVPSANRITLLRDSDGDGAAETRSVFLSGLNSPFGIALVKNTLYVANSDAVVKFPYAEGATQIAVAGTKVVDLPAGPRNHHWTKNIIVSPDGSKLYAAVGSNSNVAEHGIEEEEGRAAIWEVDLATGNHRVFASGLRNPVGMAWEPESGALWTAVNERDELGSDLVPDYMTSVRDGGFYGWPYSYYGQHVDTRVKPQRSDLVAKALVPDYALGPHTASLGLASSEGTSLPDRFRRGMFVGQHGSWNRKPRSGYKVIFVPFNGGTPSGEPVDVLTGFVKENGDAMGRPVGVAIDKRGALLVADDVGNAIWRVSSADRAEAPPAAPAAPAARELLPAPTGPFKIGTTRWHVTDAARPETFAAAGTHRQVEVFAWYPAAAAGASNRGEPAPYLREGMAEVPPRLREPLGSLANVRTHAILDAPPIESPEKLPVLVFSHGLGGSPSAHTALLEDLASHGYAVISIVHPYEATAATLADGQVISLFNETGKPRAAFDEVIAEWEHEDETMAAVTKEATEEGQLRLLRGYLAGLRATNATLKRWVDDTKLVLDRLSELPKTSMAGRLASRLDMSRLGALGHSMGGVTSGQFCLEDRRCRAGLNLDGIPQYGTMIDQRLSVPFLMVYSARQGRTGASDAIYRRAATRYHRVDVQNTLHLDFSDMILWGGPLRQGALGTLAPARAVEITRTIVLQYFDQELRGKPSPLLAGKQTLPEATVRSFPPAAPK